MNRIKDLRTDADMKQADLAARLNIARSVISKYELNQVDLSTDTIRQLCEIFHVTADYLLGLSNVRDWGISAEEYAVLAAYRAADGHTRELVDLALRPYQAEEKTNTAAG